MSQYTLTDPARAAGDFLERVLPAEYTGRVVKADDRGPRLDQPFATFKVIDDQAQTATASSRLRDTAGASAGTFVRQFRQTRRAVLSVNVYGPDAYADLTAALLKMHVPTVVEDTRADGLTVQSSGTIRRIPGDGLTTREDRAQVDLTVQYVQALDVDTEAVEEATGTGTQDLEGRSITTTL